MRTSVIAFLLLVMAHTNGGAQEPDKELAKLKGTWIASGVWRNGQQKLDVFETGLQSMFLFRGNANAQFLGGQLGVPDGFDWRENMKVRVLPKQQQLVFSFPANETKGKQQATVRCSYTLKEGGKTDELILNFEEGKKSEKWTFYRMTAKKTAPTRSRPVGSAK